MSNKETIEEAAERIYREYPNNPLDKPDWKYNRDVNYIRKRKAFIKGAQHQAKTMYSEEEMIIIMDSYADDVMGGCNLRAKEWFEQLNKKNNEQ